jgi:hypothetical protein
MAVTAVNRSMSILKVVATFSSQEKLSGLVSPNRASVEACQVSRSEDTFGGLCAVKLRDCWKRKFSLFDNLCYDLKF